MRVLMFAPTYPPNRVGGLERQAHLLSRELAANGCGVHVLTHDGPQDGSLVFEGLGVTRLVARSWSHRAAALGQWLRRYSSHFDVCHTHGLSSVSIFVANVCRAMGLPTLVKLPNVGAAGIPGMLDRSLGWLWKLGFLRADAVVAMAPQNLTELDAVGFPRRRVFCTNNGVKLGAAVRDHEKADGPPVFIFSGRLSADKGIRDLLMAWSLALPDLPRGSKLRLVGDGPLMGEARAAAEAPSASGSIDCVGWLPSAIGEYPTADVCVLPSYAEGNSNTVLEAMATGLPILATDVGGTRLLVGEEGSGGLLWPGDIPGLVRAMVRLGGDRAQRGRLGRLMRERAVRRFGIDVVARAYMTVYAALSEGRRDDVNDCSIASLEPSL